MGWDGWAEMSSTRAFRDGNPRWKSRDGLNTKFPRYGMGISGQLRGVAPGLWSCNLRTCGLYSILKVCEPQYFFKMSTVESQRIFFRRIRCREKGLQNRPKKIMTLWPQKWLCDFALVSIDRIWSALLLTVNKNMVSLGDWRWKSEFISEKPWLQLFSTQILIVTRELECQLVRPLND